MEDSIQDDPSGKIAPLLNFGKLMNEGAKNNEKKKKKIRIIILLKK